MQKKKESQKKEMISDSEIKLRRKIRNKIVKACKEAGTYKNTYDMVIDDLADILVMRESAIESYRENGNAAIIEHVNIGGNSNYVKNPAITIIIEINQLALSYWRELGLTPKGFKNLGAEVVKEEKSALLTLINKIEQDSKE